MTVGTKGRQEGSSGFCPWETKVGDKDGRDGRRGKGSFVFSCVGGEEIYSLSERLAGNLRRKNGTRVTCRRWMGFEGGGEGLDELGLLRRDVQAGLRFGRVNV